MYRVFIVCCFLGCVTNIAHANDRVDYAERYAYIAVSEMHRTGIPASIKLAQGILESNAGKSILATKANNHFGMKCGAHWRGKTFYREDDDRNKRGKLIKSCFRYFSTSTESYVAHSEFLTDPAKAYRYGPLFKLKSDDYKSWARGLKKAGYATNPKYAQLLIKIIEDYRLYTYDSEIPPGSRVLETNHEDVLVEMDEVDQFSKNHEEPSKIEESPAEAPLPSPQIIQYYNRAKYVLAQNGETPESISRKFKISVHQVMKYNDELKSRKHSIETASRVFIQPKRKKFKGRQKYHIVKSTENLSDISRLYGVCESSLRKRNKLNSGDWPAQGQKIYLKGKNPKPVKVRQQFLEDVTKPESQRVISSEKTETEDPIHNKQSEKNPSIEKISDRVYHTVQPKETLYGIAKAYGLTVEMLKKLNNLAANTIFSGQALIIQ